MTKKMNQHICENLQKKKSSDFKFTEFRPLLRVKLTFVIRN